MKMEYRANLFLPNQLVGRKEKILEYFKNEISFSKAKEYIYGGKDLTQIIDEVGFEIRNEKMLLVKINFYLRGQEVLRIDNVSFRQLTVESSNNFLEKPVRNWGKLTMQRRLEVCQHELSRWSVQLKTKDFIATGPTFSNQDFTHIELINNCTTNKGFELKMGINEKIYHASFKMPKEVYLPFCVQQAGSEAKQGWDVDWFGRSNGPDGDHGLCDPDSYPEKEFNPTFGQIYWEEKFHARKSIKIDLDIYREITHVSQTGIIDINNGEINYQRWTTALGPNNEYIDKSHRRKLIIDSETSKYKKPPKTYKEVLDGSYQFKFPLFRENGIYDVTEPKESSHYPVLSKMNSFTLSELTNGNQELSLEIDDPAPLELARIIVGNIKIGNIPIYPEIMTLDRFCFSPRKTNSRYDKDWQPPSLTKKRDTIYAFILASNNEFIQAEGWGVERMVLSKNEDGNIVIDLFSYERILPVWQGTLILKKRRQV